MCGANKKDPRNALASWNGYEFQGQIAIIVILEMLIKKEYDYKECKIKLEDLEDFSVYHQHERISTHQVKATIGNSIKNYGEALYYMAKSLQDNKECKTTKAYLHTSNELNITNWKAEIQAEIEEFMPQKEKELCNALGDTSEISRRIKKLRERYASKNTTFKTKRAGVWEEVYNLMDDVSSEKEITGQNLKKAIREYISRIEGINLDVDNLLDRIIYYTYNDGKNVARNESRERIEKLILEYWGEEKAESRKGSEGEYRLALQDIISRYVIEHHNGNGDEAIEFSTIKEVLDKTSQSTKESMLLRNKDVFFEEMDAYCFECKKMNTGCNECDLHQKKLWVSGMTDSELERFFYMMSPDVNQSVEKNSNIVHEKGIKDSYFYTLDNKDFGEIKYNSMIVYQKEDANYMLTDIEIPRHGKSGIYRGLVQNKGLEEICEGIMGNREFAKERMEIDALIVANYGTPKVEMKELCAKSTDVCKDEDNMSYLKITRKKDIFLMDAEHFTKD